LIFENNPRLGAEGVLPGREGGSAVCEAHPASNAKLHQRANPRMSLIMQFCCKKKFTYVMLRIALQYQEVC
jgi:hypothetical protein